MKKFDVEIVNFRMQARNIIQEVRSLLREEKLLKKDALKYQDKLREIFNKDQIDLKIDAFYFYGMIVMERFVDEPFEDCAHYFEEGAKLKDEACAHLLARLLAGRSEYPYTHVDGNKAIDYYIQSFLLGGCNQTVNTPLRELSKILLIGNHVIKKDSKRWSKIFKELLGLSLKENREDHFKMILDQMLEVTDPLHNYDDDLVPIVADILSQVRLSELWSQAHENLLRELFFQQEKLGNVSVVTLSEGLNVLLNTSEIPSPARGEG